MCLYMPSIGYVSLYNLFPILLYQLSIKTHGRVLAAKKDVWAHQCVIYESSQVTVFTLS